MEFILCMAGWALRFLAIGVGFFVFKWILGDGKETIKELIRTTGVAIQAGCVLVRRKLVEKLEKKERVLQENEDPTKVEAHVV